MPAPSQHISDLMALAQGRWWWFRPYLGALAHPSFQAPVSLRPSGLIPAQLPSPPTPILLGFPESSAPLGCP